jgi:cell division protein FtsZ
MINANVSNIEFITANTDGQALSRSLTPRQIQLGKNITSGLGAGSDSEIGRQAAEESLEEVIAELGDSNMLFITTGMGGGTGSGAAPIIAKAAKDKGILTVAVVTKPFDFEGKKRMEVAEECLNQLRESVDTLIVIPNQNLFKIANEKTTFAEAFKMADDVLYQGVCGITNLITDPGMINLDFADIKTVMGNMGKAMMGTGESSGEGRAKKAAEEALNNPLLDESDIRGAKSILLNIQGGPDMALFEVDEAASKIRNEVDENANIIFGSSIDNNLEGIIKVSIVATGISKDKNYQSLNFDNKLENYNEIEDVDDKHNFNNNVDLETEIKATDDNQSFSHDRELEKEDLETTSIDESLENNNNNQIDLETQINLLKTDQDNLNKNNFEILESENDLPEQKNEELKSILLGKPQNELTEKKPNTFFNRFSSFFSSTNEKKIPPIPITKLEEKIEKTGIDISKKSDASISNTETHEHFESFDLFKGENQAKASDHDNLIDLEQETKEIDDKVLEIPAFLRRQAN